MLFRICVCLFMTLTVVNVGSAATMKRTINMQLHEFPSRLEEKPVHHAQDLILNIVQDSDRKRYTIGQYVVEGPVLRYFEIRILEHYEVDFWQTVTIHEVSRSGELVAESRNENYRGAPIRIRPSREAAGGHLSVLFEFSERAVQREMHPQGWIDHSWHEYPDAAFLRVPILPADAPLPVDAPASGSMALIAAAAAGLACVRSRGLRGTGSARLRR